MNDVFSIFGIASNYNESEYYNLSDEEKKNYDYMNSCLFSENKNISDASFYIMMLLLKISENPDIYEPEDIHDEMDKIFEGLNASELETMNKFIPSCINSMGIYSEEAKQERKLRKERNDL